jgi:NAD(P)-dependent dehydrogenase (short-subunit alcohol dehydrogenase family)
MASQPVAVVTGAAQGIGARIAEVLGSIGYRLALFDRQSIVGPPGALCGTGDVAHEDDVAGFADAVDEAFGQVDVLVNNAGISCIRPAEETPAALWRQVLEVNLTGPFLLCQQFGRRMLARRSGSIVNIASLAGLRGAPNNAAYGAGKGAMVILTKDMAVDYAPQGVRVNAVCPAYIETDLNREMLNGLKKTGEYEALVKMHLLGRLGEPDDVAYATVYLASDEAKWLSGVTLGVDGGISATR